MLDTLQGGIARANKPAHIRNTPGIQARRSCCAMCRLVGGWQAGLLGKLAVKACCLARPLTLLKMRVDPSKLCGAQKWEGLEPGLNYALGCHP